MGVHYCAMHVHAYTHLMFNRSNHNPYPKTPIRLGGFAAGGVRHTR